MSDHQSSDPNEQRTAAEEHAQVLEKQAAMRKRSRRKAQEPSGVLNINSLMDIMTIMLVFLLVSVTSDPLNIRENDFLKLSRASGTFPPVYSVPVEINKNWILVDQKETIPVTCTYQGRMCNKDDGEHIQPDAKFSIDGTYKENGKESSLLIVKLKEGLDRAVKKVKDQNVDLEPEKAAIVKANEGVVTIICDRDMPFRLVAEVVYTAAQAQLHNIRFAIVYSQHR